jgi:hypothetical protein
MKFIKKLIPLFFLALLVMACGKDNEEDATLLGEWQEIERIDPDHPDRTVSARDTTIVFYPDGRFEGSVIVPDTRYSIDGERLRLYRDDENHNSVHLFSYSIKGNKLTLDLDSGPIPENIPSPQKFIYKKLNTLEP